MNRYTEYKDSGIEWIGKIPNHWIVNRVSRITYVKGRIGWKGLTSEEFIDEGPYLVTGTDFQNGRIDWSGTYHVNEIRFNDDPFIVLQKDDVLITKDGTIGKVAQVQDLPGPATLNSGIFVTRPLSNSYIQRYFYWILNSGIFSDYVDYSSSGTTIQHLYQNVFEQFLLPIPPRPEQFQVSNHLDTKTAQIDSLIEKIEQKIELLKELRTTLICQCVTKGLDPNVEMKDSGIEWIGEIPKYWEIKKITYITTRIGSGATPKSDNKRYYSNGTIPWLVTGDLIDSRISEVTNQITPLAIDEYSTLKIWPSHSLVIAMYGATIGKLGLLNFPSTVNQACCVCVFTSDNSPKYWFYAMLASRMRILSMSYGGGQPNISQDLLKSLRFASPPLCNQTQISQFLDKKTSQIDSLIEKLERKIELHKEYRQSLISNVVTGKIRVTEPTA